MPQSHRHPVESSRTFALLLMFLACAAALPAVAQMCVEEDFDSWSAQGQPNSSWSIYDSDVAQLTGCSYPVSWASSSSYCIASVPGGDDDGSGAARLIMRSGRNQFEMGWYFAGCSGWTHGDTIHYRLSVKFDSSYRWNDGGQGHKMATWGRGDGHRMLFIANSPNLRDAVTCMPPNGRRSCNNDGAACDSDADCMEGGVQYRCITPTALWENGTGGAWRLNDNIALPCVGPVPAEGYTNDIWYYVQMEVRSSNTNNGHLKLWVNNNDEAHPDMEVHGINIGVNEWHDTSLGFFWTDAKSTDRGFFFGRMNVERNGSFDPGWYPGGTGGGGGATEPPPVPGNLRRGDLAGSS